MGTATHPPFAGGQPIAFGSGQILAGRYRVVAFLGGGSVGEVFEAEDLELGVRIALKVLHPGSGDEKLLQRFKQEIQLAQRVSHPNVCRTYDLAYHGEAPSPRVFLTMEMLRGETLADRLARQGRMTPGEALPILRQVAGALSAAHTSGVVHRDLKSANIFLETPPAGAGEPRAVVTDFGLAWSSDAADPAAGGELTVSPAYMAPEQVRGDVATPATDVYSLGVVLYEMVTGELPFVGSSAFYTAVKRLKEPPPPPREKLPSLDPAWNAAILRCLEREPAGRFATPAELVAALAQPQSAAPVPPARRSLSRTVWVRAAAALGAFYRRLRARIGAPKAITAEASEIARVVTYLKKHLGQGVTAYLSGADDPHLVDKWEAGKAEPNGLPGLRLRSAYQAAKYVVEAYGDETAQDWFFGMNPALADTAPAYVLRHGSSPEHWSIVVPAAMEFVETAR